MLDHVTLRVRDFSAAVAFYDAALAPLGLAAMARIDEENEWAVAYGADRPFFWIGAARAEGARGGAHIAFAAPSIAAVDGFHRAGLGAGGRDNGPPGLRPHYDPGYYAAFLFDPDGNNIEAVHRGRAG